MPEIRIVVQSGPRGIAFSPVGLDLDVPVGELAELALLDEASGVIVPFQAEPGDGSCRISWIVDSMGAGQTRTYVLTDAVAPTAGPVVDLSEQDGGRIEVKIGGEVFTCYHYGEDMPRPVLYPVIGPFGRGVTRPFPMETVEDDETDHVHHRSIWVAWGDVNGSDNWSETEEGGRVLHRGFDGWGGGPVFGWIAARNDWVDVGGKKLMEDRTVHRFYNLPQNMRVLDLDVTLNASEGDVRFGDTKEGGFCSVRVAGSMNGTVGGRIENSFGAIGEPEAWGKRASWCDYSGPVGAHTVGIAAFDHPGNVGYPTYWHVRDYGLMAANPFALSHFLHDPSVDGSWVLPAGERTTFRYRVFIHPGDATEGGVKDKYLDWVYPPAASLVE